LPHMLLSVPILHDMAYDPVTSKIAWSDRHYLGGMDSFPHL